VGGKFKVCPAKRWGAKEGYNMTEMWSPDAQFIESMTWAYTEYKNARNETEKLAWLKSLEGFVVDLVTEAYRNTERETESLIKYVKAYASFLPESIFECLVMKKELERLEIIKPLYERLESELLNLPDGKTQEVP
jgi:hypothetical protein